MEDDGILTFQERHLNISASKRPPWRFVFALINYSARKGAPIELAVPRSTHDLALVMISLDLCYVLKG